MLNASVEGDSIAYHPSENISIAVETERGLLTPVLRDAGDKNIAQIAGEIADLAARTRSNKLTPDELAGGTFTLTNTGSRGAHFDTPLVFLPQSAILGTGSVVKKAAALFRPPRATRLPSARWSCSRCRTTTASSMVRTQPASSHK